MSGAVALSAVLLSCSISGLGTLFWGCCALILDFGVVESLVVALLLLAFVYFPAH